MQKRKILLFFMLPTVASVASGGAGEPSAPESLTVDKALLDEKTVIVKLSDGKSIRNAGGTVYLKVGEGWRQEKSRRD